MDLQSIQDNWDRFGKRDPFWAILSDPGKRWTKGEFFLTGRLEIAGVIDYLHSLGLDPKRGRALDFGCGVGRATQALCESFSECHGVDIAPSMIDLANKYNRFGKCRYHLNNSSDLGLFEANFFDFVYSNLVLQHMSPEYSSRYIKEFVRVLNHGGILLFQLPSGPSESEPAPFKAAVHLLDVPETMKAGSEVTILARVKNLSEAIWNASGRTLFRLGNHWLDDKKRCLVNDDGRMSLPHDLKPQDEVVLQLSVHVPISNGTYFLEVDMVQEYISWFKARGSQTAFKKVQVLGGRMKQLGPSVAINGLRRLPEILRRSFLRKLQSATEPVMEMHSIPKAEVIDLVQRSGGKVIDAHRYDVSGAELVGYRYCCTK